jgi:hypothetical protein
MPFALFKPPFDRGLGAPDGTVWLSKTGYVLDTVRRYQVVDSAGKFVRRFTSIGAPRLIGVSPSNVIMVNRDSARNELRLLEVRIPARPPRTATH